jgi:hypothetical protein
MRLSGLQRGRERHRHDEAGALDLSNLRLAGTPLENWNPALT